MKRVYASPTPLMTGFVQGILEQAGIGCVLKNQFLNSASGELPVNETWPELWVRDEDEPRALREIRNALAGDAHAAGWTCPNCGEVLEGQFQACWNCGHDRDDSSEQ